jgi:hypothetical protein
MDVVNSMSTGFRSRVIARGTQRFAIGAANPSMSGIPEGFTAG